jgi:hypothetical protein
VSATIPRDACRLFGPDRPLGKAGDPGGRPADPDGTGGFFQPGLVGGAGASPTLFDVRVRCTLPSVTQEVSLEFEKRYRANTNPEIALVARLRDGAVEPIDSGVEIHAAPGETIRLRVGWPECPESEPCGGAEHYVSYDPSSRRIVDRRESMAVSWLTTRGTFATPRTGRSESDLVTNTESSWTAPTSTGPAAIFVVLRDARGGTEFRALPVSIQ